MDLERERGITIKANTVRSITRRGTVRNMLLKPHRHAGPCRLAYEVSRSLAACEGSLLASMPRRASRPRPSPMSIRRSTITRDSWRSSTGRSPRRRARAIRQQIEDVIGIDASRPFRFRQTARACRSSRSRRASPSPAQGDRHAPLKALLVDSCTIAIWRRGSGPGSSTASCGRARRSSSSHQRGYQLDRVGVSRPKARDGR